MSNKTQLQTNNTSLDGYIARINAAKEVAAGLPEAGGGGSGGTVSVTVKNQSFDTVYFFDANQQVQTVESGVETTISPLNGVLWLSSSGMPPYPTQGDCLSRYIGDSFYIFIFLSDGILVCPPIDIGV